MSPTDLTIVVALASAAVVLTLLDLAFSAWRHRRRTSVARAARRRAAVAASSEADNAARREWISRRLNAIQSGRPSQQPPAGESQAEGT